VASSPLEVYQLQFSKGRYARNRITPDHDYVLGRLPASGTLLDIGSGRGVFLRKVQDRFPELKLKTCDLQDFHHLGLPFFPLDLTNPADLERLAGLSEPLISCVGVLEHLPEDRVLAAIEAISRACTGTALITAANHSDIGKGGHQLHLTQQPLPWWVERLGKHFEVTDARTYLRGKGLCFTCVAPVP
jgi:hypothetical protein